jgi:hypothetical protein
MAILPNHRSLAVIGIDFYCRPFCNAGWDATTVLPPEAGAGFA